MADWSLEHNTYLSTLLDDVTGTEESVGIRQEYCKIYDCIASSDLYNYNQYFMDTKAEGLDLPGSDDDFMFDTNNPADIAVSESFQFNFTYRYIDDVLSINNPDFENYLGQMYPPELEIKDTTENNTSASYLDLLLSIGRDGQLHTSLYDKRDDFNFHITNFPFLSSNIPSSPAYGVFISQLIRYASACSSYECFILRAMRLSNRLLGQGYVKERLKSSLRKFYGRYGDLTKQYEVPLSRILHDILDDDHIQ